VKRFSALLIFILLLFGSVAFAGEAQGKNDKPSPGKAAAGANDYIKRATELVKRHRELAEWCERNGFEEEAEAHNKAADELEEKIKTAKRGKSAAPTKGRPDTPVGQNLKTFDAVWKTVRDKFYDEDLHGVDWKAMYDKYLPIVKKARSKREFYDTCNRMLGELKASHCYLASEYVWRNQFGNEFRGKASLQAGIEIQKRGRKFFVRTVYDGGPAEKAGVLVGDEVVKVNGEAPAESPFLVVKDGISTAKRALFTLKTTKDTPVALELRRKRNGKIIKKKIIPQETSMIEAARNSARVIERGGKKIGYIHLWHYMRKDIYWALRRALTGKLKDCDGLVLDIRGRGGSPKTLFRILRVFTSGIFWNKDVVLVVDEETASAKEIFAYHWKKEKLGPVVGLKTAGHVLACAQIRMPDGSVLFLATGDVPRMTGGVRLEGKGVEPDVEVTESFEYCAGNHPILKKAAEVLLIKMNKKPVKKKPGRWHFFEDPAPAPKPKKAA